MGLFDDSLNTHITFTILICLAAVVWIKQIFLQPNIACAVPAQFTQPHTDYAHQVCSQAEHYYLPELKDSFMENTQSMLVNSIKIVPYILALQAFLTILPLIFWKCLSSLSLTPLKGLESMAKHCLKADSNVYTNLCNNMALRMKSYLKTKNISCFLGLSYAFIRILYCIIAFVNLGITSNFVAVNTLPFYTPDSNATVSNDSINVFPKLVLCDYKIRSMSRVHNYVMQCVLGDNYAYESLLKFTAVWFLFLGTVNIVSFIKLVINLLFVIQHDIKSLVQNLDQNIGSILGCDGSLITMHVSQVSNEAIAVRMLQGALDGNNENIQLKEKQEENSC